MARKARNTVSFKATPEENRAIFKIVKRAGKLAAKEDPDTPLDEGVLMMDLAACNANGTPLRLDALLEADDFNFAHDVFGIHRHIDRKTGQLGDCFVPRFAVPQTN